MGTQAMQSQAMEQVASTRRLLKLQQVRTVIQRLDRSETARPVAKPRSIRAGSKSIPS